MPETPATDRDTLASLIANFQSLETWHKAAFALTDRILASDWLADLLAAERARTLAPILALADEYQRHGKDGAGAGWFVVARELRAACDPAAATRHDNDACSNHRPPQGPNEDVAQCPKCWGVTYTMRPEGETFGHHLPDCSLPIHHESYCEPGGTGHPDAKVIRG